MQTFTKKLNAQIPIKHFSRKNTYVIDFSSFLLDFPGWSNFDYTSPHRHLFSWTFFHFNEKINLSTILGVQAVSGYGPLYSGIILSCIYNFLIFRPITFIWHIFAGNFVFLLFIYHIYYRLLFLVTGIIFYI